MTRSLIIAILLATTVARADDRADAEQLYRAGQTAFDAKQYDVALVAWQKSFELSREPGLLFNVAQAYRLRAGKGDCANAETAYRKFIASVAHSKERDAARKYADEMHACALREQPEPAHEPSPPEQPTPAPTAAPATQDLPDEPEPAADEHGGARIAGLAAMIGGAGLVVTGAYFAIHAHSLGDDVTSACANGCNWADEKSSDGDGHRAEVLGWVFGGIGAAAIVGGVLVYVHARTERPHLGIVERRGGAVLTWEASW